MRGLNRVYVDSAHMIKQIADIRPIPFTHAETTQRQDVTN